MRRISLMKIFPFALVVIMAACSTSKQTTSLPERSDIKGTWLLDRINYDGLPAGQPLKITLLDEGNDACLIGSTWVFPNNGNGTYTLVNNGSGCVAGQRNIVWSYQKSGDQPMFQFKRMPGGVKAKDVPDGYRFKIINATENELILQSEVSYQGGPILINYNFSKK